MGQIDELWRYDGRRVVVTGCASGIGASVARQLTELGAEVIGLGRATRRRCSSRSSTRSTWQMPHRSTGPSRSIDGPVDSLFNIAGVSSGIRDPLRVVTINFLGTRRFTEALIPAMPPGSAIANVSSLAASEYRTNAGVTAGLLDTESMSDGIEWCHRNSDALADGGYRLSKEAIILYGMANVATLGAKGIRINCTAPGVTDTPILDQLRASYGQEFLDSFQTPLGRVAGPDEQASVLVFLNSGAAGYITGQVIWVDGGAVAERVFGDLSDAREVERRRASNGRHE